MKYNKNLDLLSVNTLKVNGVAAINKANSGHPGIVLGAAKIMHALFSRHLVFNPMSPKWINRDRFILSAGHGSALLYAQLRILGLLSEDDLKNFRQLNSLTPGHPEYGHTLGVEATTGPLGQGIGMGVGLALAESHLHAKFPEINHYTYVLCGDGDLQEGVANEALSLAGKLQLNKLIVLHDSNEVQLDTPVDEVSADDLRLKMESLGFKYFSVKNDVNKISKAIAKAKKSKKPSFIEVRTVIGEGATKQGTSDVHGAPLGEDFETVKENLGWTYGDFELPEEVENYYRETLFVRGEDAFNNFVESQELRDYLANASKAVSLDLELKKNDATRNSSGTVVKHLNTVVPHWIGGSADLVASTKVGGADGVFSKENRLGRNILFGVREFAMGTIANGIALHSVLRPFVSTFFVFSDYIKPAMRLSSLMNLPVTYIFTHDSVFVGEDGPTHQPIEQLAMLRSLPGLIVLRPADEKEVLGAYELAINAINRPHAIVLTRQNIVSLETTDKELFKKGSYLIHKTDSPYALIATGSELANALKIGQELNLNVISASHWDNRVLWNPSKAISIEASSTFGWSKVARHNIGHNCFGYSAPGDLVYKEIKLDYDSVKKYVVKHFNLESKN
ncbi:transketolase [Mesomycoplasma lagogenitalium]|uniref:Transketolase n=1 Tax=Mesomycoplasma lagogenitalium TaxID=171286 RepID=A0ABY8LWF4_9BACT|nr:transketolase [Mesomycoplasma lagogenitalium]WGI36883.1 transketolase [Mesomycoplasma lagogenitalium]